MFKHYTELLLAACLLLQAGCSSLSGERQSTTQVLSRHTGAAGRLPQGYSADAGA